jgi:hypothetical protein
MNGLHETVEEHSEDSFKSDEVDSSVMSPKNKQNLNNDLEICNISVDIDKLNKENSKHDSPEPQLPQQSATI